MIASLSIPSAAILFILSAAVGRSAQPNVLTAEETRLGFELIFDGRSFEGWRHAGNWVIDDAALCSKEESEGNIFYIGRLMPADFEVRFEWKVSKGANGGVLYRPGQYEYQLLDNANSRHGENPRTSAASLFFCMAPSRDVTRPFGEWNEGRIVAKGTVIQHWLNGEKVIDFDYSDPRWARNIALFRIRGLRPPYAGNLGARGEFLRLQNHGGEVWYRNLRLRPIPSAEKLQRSAIEEMPMPPAGVKYEQDRIAQIFGALKVELAQLEAAAKRSQE